MIGSFDKRGQSRTVEAIFASLIILFSFSFASHAVFSGDPSSTSSRGDLEMLGYNVLKRLARAGSFEQTVLNGGLDWEKDLKLAVTKLLSQGVYFNLTIYNITFEEPIFTRLVRINTLPISNVERGEAPRAFLNAPEVASANYIYTSRENRILLFRLVLATSSGGGR